MLLFCWVDAVPPCLLQGQNLLLALRYAGAVLLAFTFNRLVQVLYVAVHALE